MSRPVRALLFLLAAAALLMAPAVIAGPGNTDSAVFNYVWTKQFAHELARGHLYPRWMPDSFEGLGSPAFYFYPPVAFLLSGLIAMAAPVQTAIAITATLTLFASGVAMFAWLRDKSRWALPAAILYMAAPYHLSDFYMRGALAEFAAFVWPPLIALAIEKIERRWGPPVLALSYAGLILTHLPTAVLASVFLIAPLVLLRPGRTPVTLLRTAASGLAGLMLAAPYLLPALSLRGVIHNEVFSSPFFQPDAWSLWRVTPITANDLRVFSVLALGWSVLALGAAAGARIWLGITVVAAASSLAVLPAFWTLPILHDVQFPWRLLSLVEFAGITCLALRPPGRAAAASGALMLTLGTVPLIHTAVWRAAQPLPARLDVQMTDGVEYLPADLHGIQLKPGSAPDLSRLRRPLVSGPVGSVSRRDDSGFSLDVVAPGNVTLRLANFPAWRVLGPAGDTPLLKGPLVSFEATLGHYEVVRSLLPVERLGWGLALLGGLALLLTQRRLPARAPAHSSPGVFTVNPALRRRSSTPP